MGEDGWYRARKFEPHEERLPRAQRFLKELMARQAGTQDRVAIVSHGGFFNLFMTALLGLDNRNGRWFVMNNAAISRFDFHEDHVAAVYLTAPITCQPTSLPDRTILMRILSCNIRYSPAPDGDNRWAFRRDLACAWSRACCPTWFASRRCARISSTIFGRG